MTLIGLDFKLLFYIDNNKKLLNKMYMIENNESYTN